MTEPVQERRDHEIAVRLAEETGGGVEELTPSLKRSSAGEWEIINDLNGLKIDIRCYVKVISSHLNIHHFTKKS